ncbi:CAP domain-containing protein [Halocatena marina]|uniref:CAP domain-containing protein n=1 Tax=Halocatena marina TaxID=2934937 RepID=A0ABD5YKE7_9EURY
MIRTENNLSKLEHSGEIATISRTYSYDMGEREYFSHVSPEGRDPTTGSVICIRASATLLAKISHA